MNWVYSLYMQELKNVSWDGLNDDWRCKLGRMETKRVPQQVLQYAPKGKRDGKTTEKITWK